MVRQGTQELHLIMEDPFSQRTCDDAMDGYWRQLCTGKDVSSPTGRCTHAEEEEEEGKTGSILG